MSNTKKSTTTLSAVILSTLLLALGVFAAAHSRNSLSFAEPSGYVPSTVYWCVTEDMRLVISGSEDDTAAVTDPYYKGSFQSDAAFTANGIPWRKHRRNIKFVKVKKGVAPLSTAYWFYDFLDMTYADLYLLDTSNVTDMRRMFIGCMNLIDVDISEFDTSKVTNMSGMFASCNKVASLDVSNFDTSNVTNMSGMFTGCREITSIDLSSFDTSNVTNMSGMFSGCSGITSIDVSSFDTSNVTNMSGMFSGCNGITSIDVSSFNTSNVTDMSSMFSGCNGITSIDISNFDTSKVTYMSKIFSGCSGITSIDVSNFDTSNVKSMYDMFSSCKSLTDVDVSSFNTKNITFLNSMFQDCEKLKILDISSFDIADVQSVSSMLRGCDALDDITAPAATGEKSIDLPGKYFNGSAYVKAIDSASAGKTLTRHECGGGTATCSARAVCSGCGEAYGELLPHTITHFDGKASTCTEAGWKPYDACSKCDYTTFEALPIAGHTWNSEALRIDPSCTEKGVIIGECTVCGKADVEVFPALGHDIVRHEGKSATCTESGHEPYSTCTRCNYSTYRELPALGHDNIEYDEQSATCTRDGHGAYTKCRRCGYTTEHRVTPALGHVYNDDWTVSEEPTLKKEGLRVRYCHRCGRSQTEIIPKCTTSMEIVNTVTAISIQNPDGFASEAKLYSYKYNLLHYQSFAETIGCDKSDITEAYLLRMERNGVMTQPVGKTTVKMLVPDQLAGRDFKLYHIDGGNKEELAFSRDGEYIEFDVTALGDFVFTDNGAARSPDGSDVRGDAKGMTIGEAVAISVGATLAACFALLIVYKAVRSRKAKSKQPPEKTE